MGEMTSWDSFVEAARGYGVSGSRACGWPWCARSRRRSEPLEECLALVSTRRFADGYAALEKSGVSSEKSGVSSSFRRNPVSVRLFGQEWKKSDVSSSFRARMGGEKGDSHQIDRRDIHSRSGLRKPSGTDAIVD